MLDTVKIVATGSFVAWSTSTIVYLSQSRKHGNISLDDTNSSRQPSLGSSTNNQYDEELADQLADYKRELDGYPINTQECQRRIHRSRIAICVESLSALALLLVQLMALFPWKDVTWRDAFHKPECWPILTSALVWVNILVLTLRSMQQGRHWNVVVQVSSLTACLMLSCVTLLVIPDAVEQDQIPYYCAQLVLVLVVLADVTTVPSGPKRVKDTPNGTIKMARFSDKGQTIMSLLWFTNAWDIVRIARIKGKLDEIDIPQMGSDFDSVALYARFSECYERRRKSVKISPATNKRRFETLHACWQILSALYAANRSQMITTQILAGAMGFAFYVPSYVSLRIVRFLEDSEKDGQTLSSLERLRFGFPYCLLLVSTIMFSSLGLGQLFRICMASIRCRLRAQLQLAIFSKALRRKDISEANELAHAPQSPDGKAQNGDEEPAESFSKTQIFNLVSVDTERITNVNYLIIFSMAPAEIAVGGFFAIYLLRWGAVIGLASSFLLQPIIFLVGKVIARIQARLQGVRDRKTSLLNEIIQAIRMVKYNAWEEKVSARVEKLRDEELRYQKLVYLTESLQGFVFHLSPLLVTVIAYAWLTLVEKQPLRPSVAFAAFSVLDEMRFSLTQIPEGISQVIQTCISLARIQSYLESDEVNVSTSLQKHEAHDNVRIVDATIRWPVRSQKGSQINTPPTRNSITSGSFKLVGINVSFLSEGINVIVGRLGAGKTLLLEAMLGEAEILSGQVLCPRSVANSIQLKMTIKPENWMRTDQTAYVPQSAFLVNATIKDNILFGLPMLQDRYEETLSACCLRSDLAIFEDGDETEIGENGIGLSGGQTARVMLARAIYGRARTLILDDPLSAVDASTAEELCSLFKGPLCQLRTIILVTHQVQLVAPISAKVIMLDAGRVVYNDDPTTFMQSDLYSGLVEEQDQEEKQVSSTAETTESSTTATPSTTAPPSPTLVATKTLDAKIGDSLPASDANNTTGSKQPKKLVEDEKRATGAVLLSIYGQYVRWAGGLPTAVVTIAIFAAANGFQIVVKRWLQYWSDDVLQGLGNPQARQHTDQWWLIGWAAVMLLDLVLTTVKNLILVFASLRASKIMFRSLLGRVLRAPLRFHDTVSRGRLLNRFSYDCQEIDSELVDTVERFGDQALMIVVSVYSITEGGGWPFLLFFACMVPLYAIVGRLYMTAQRDMKRLASTSRSPILNQFGDIVRGASVIRAFGAPAYFTQKLVARINENCSYNVWMMELRYWYEELFNSVSFWVMMVATVFVLLNTSISASQAGFIFTFLINIHIHIMFFLQAYTNLEQKLVSVERIVEYSNLESEPTTESKDGAIQMPLALPAQWPAQGRISVKDLHVRYAADLAEVLKGVTFEVPSAAKVGVVGATGSGKSTLASAFFRFTQTVKGSIEIDGVDISRVDLCVLRSRLQIVPQDPMIFSGPLRSTLDVFDEFSDEAILDALRLVQLIDVRDMDNEADSTSNSNVNERRDFSDLNMPIAESGSNLSQGEKQLICLARAILRQSKVILFDEATSSVDFDTDKLISQTIREAFNHSTIITIAHRLRTIIDYDFVLVLDNGKVAEFARPSELLQDPSSRFYKLCRAAGKRELAHLKSAAGVATDE